MIIGAGASGMMAAVTAAKRGLSVLVTERMDRPGKKLSATGNGRCNFTNAVMEKSCFHGDEHLLEAVLAQFSKEETLAFFHEIGVFPKEKNGYYYPNSMQASSVVEALAAQMKKNHVNLVLNSGLQAVEPWKDGFLVKTTAGSFYGKQVIFASGLLAAPKLGSVCSSMQIIKKLGHHFMPVLPVLCGFEARGFDFKKASKVRWEAELALYVDGACVVSERGELQFADYGISGIPVFQISSPAAHALYEKKETVVTINFLPDLSFREIKKELLRRLSGNPDAVSSVLLSGLLNQNLIVPVSKKAGISMNRKLDEQAVHSLGVVLHECPVILTGMRGFSFAQACAGGIKTEEIHIKTLESRLIPGIYFAGEILDVDGICGGYNLQWAWASGYVAGSAVGHD